MKPETLEAIKFVSGVACLIIPVITGLVLLLVVDAGPVIPRWPEY